MVREGLLAVGLLANAIGAIGLFLGVTATGPARRVASVTPRLRIVQRSRARLVGVARDEVPAATTDVLGHLEVLWPSVGAGRSSLPTVPFARVSGAEWHDGGWTLRDDRGRRLGHVDPGPLGTAVDELIGERYRTVGWAFLVGGLALQFVGMVL